MSYILNALRKSEQDRQARQNENQEKSHFSTQTQQRPIVLWLVIVVIIINILALVYFLSMQFQQGEPSSVSFASPSITEPVKHPEKHIPSTIHEPPLPEPILTKKAPPLAPSFVESVEQSSISELLKQRQLKKKTISKPPVKTANVATKTKPIQPKKSATETSKNKPPAVTKAKNNPAPENDIPYLHEMSPQFRRNIPDLNINMFVYSQNTADRFLIMDMKKYTTGQETENGLEIKEIKNDSLVLRYQNKTFQIKRP